MERIGAAPKAGGRRRPGATPGHPKPSSTSATRQIAPDVPPGNRQARRKAAAEQRKVQRRGETIALAHQVITCLSEDRTVLGGTLILPSGETMYFDAATLRRGGRA